MIQKKYLKKYFKIIVTLLLLILIFLITAGCTEKAIQKEKRHIRLTAKEALRLAQKALQERTKNQPPFLILVQSDWPQPLNSPDAEGRAEEWFLTFVTESGKSFGVSINNGRVKISETLHRDPQSKLPFSSDNSFVKSLKIKNWNIDSNKAIEISGAKNFLKNNPEARLIMKLFPPEWVHIREIFKRELAESVWMINAYTNDRQASFNAFVGATTGKVYKAGI